MRLADIAGSAGQALASALAGLVGGAAWVRLHRHPDLVSRDEFNLILEELRYIRNRLDELARDR